MQYVFTQADGPVSRKENKDASRKLQATTGGPHQDLVSTDIRRYLTDGYSLGKLGIICKALHKAGVWSSHCDSNDSDLQYVTCPVTVKLGVWGRSSGARAGENRAAVRMDKDVFCFRQTVTLLLCSCAAVWRLYMLHSAWFYHPEKQFNLLCPEFVFKTNICLCVVAFCSSQNVYELPEWTQTFCYYTLIWN